MIKLIINTFTKNVAENERRSRLGTLGGAVGIVLNLCLAFAKAAVGLIFGSIATVADAVNNLTDAASSVITLVGFKLARKKPDADHPYGHGRAEYISGLVMAFIVLMLGFSLAKDSVMQIIKPEKMTFSWLTVGVLSAAVIAKLWLSRFFAVLRRMTGSATFAATSADSRNDALTTLAVLLSLFVYKVFDINIDGIAGLAVSVFILISGVGLIKETLDPLLGRPPEPEFVEAVYKKTMSYDGIIGVHDLVVHDYGPGRVFVSLHAEVEAPADILDSHDLIDNIEHDFKEELGVETVIHIDPVITDDPVINKLKADSVRALSEIDERLTMHDFRAVTGPTHTNLIFDVVLPPHTEGCDVKCRFDQKMTALHPEVRTVITFDSSYI